MVVDHSRQERSDAARRRRLWRDGFGGDRLRAAAPAGGVGGLVLREQPAEYRAGVWIDQVDLCEIPGGEADFQRGEVVRNIRC